jgi:hypothetical protein
VTVLNLKVVVKGRTPEFGYAGNKPPQQNLNRRRDEHCAANGRRCFLFLEALLRDAKPFHGFASNGFGFEADMLNLNAAKGKGGVREDAKNVKTVMQEIHRISATDWFQERN